MKKGIMLVVVIILIILMISNHVKKEIAANRAQDEQMLGEVVDISTTGLGKQSAPDFTLTTLDGQQVTLSDYKGKNIVLNFWASWCVPCKAEMPDFQHYYEKYSEKDDAVILAVNMTHAFDSEEKVRQFKESYDLSFPILLEKQPSVSEQYEVITIPSTFIIDKDGRVQQYIKGPMTATSIREMMAQMNR